MTQHSGTVINNLGSSAMTWMNWGGSQERMKYDKRRELRAQLRELQMQIQNRVSMSGQE